MGDNFVGAGCPRPGIVHRPSRARKPRPYTDLIGEEKVERLAQNDLFEGTRRVGMVMFIPMALAAGPLMGYFAGDYLQKQWGMPSAVVTLCIVVGLVAGVYEVYRIIKVIQKELKD